ncbi:MAG: polyprenyl synthetase family protein [Chloroflexi bacterium]|nr:polyprenyl synthetase family protein [Chloroflexota bacterium]
MKVPDELAEASSVVEPALEQFMAGRSLPLYRMMSYHLGWVDEQGTPVQSERPVRTRGGLALLGARAVAGEMKGALRHAIAVELIHNYSEIHQDVQEGNTDSAGRPSVWWIWGPAQAINAGDGMHALARLALFGLKEQGVPTEKVSAALRTLDEATLQLCEGSYLDTVFQDRLTIGVDEYLEMAGRASGALVGCAVRLGAMAGGENDSARLDALSEFGSKIGTGLRAAADYRVFWSDGEREAAVQGRVLSKKKTLPVVHALESAAVRDKRALGEVYAQRVLDPKDLEKVASILEEAGSRAFTEKTIARLAAEAFSALDRAGLPSGQADVLRSVLDLVGGARN